MQQVVACIRDDRRRLLTRIAGDKQTGDASRLIALGRISTGSVDSVDWISANQKTVGFTRTASQSGKDVETASLVRSMDTRTQRTRAV